MKANLKRATIGELLALSRQVLVKLRSRDVIRTTNAPTGDYAEWLVQRVVKGTFGVEVKSKLGRHDAERGPLAGQGTGSRRHQEPRPTSVVSVPVLGLPFAVIVLFDDDFKVRKAACLSAEQLKAVARYAKHVNGHLVFATDELLAEGEDWTQLEARSTATRR
jgi:hypothetical protein